MDRKRKRILLYISTGILLAAATYVSLPYYARQALIHLMPVIDDLNTFHRDTVHNTPSAVWFWPHTNDYNRHRLSPEDSAYLDELKTVAFLVIQHDSIVFESYRNGWNDSLTSNIYSATKTIVGLLAGIALDEGKIHNLDDPVSTYIPQYTKGKQKEVTVRNLLTMSAGMAWDESYASLFSVTTHGYYGNDLYKLVTELDVNEQPGIQYDIEETEVEESIGTDVVFKEISSRSATHRVEQVSAEGCAGNHPPREIPHQRAKIVHQLVSLDTLYVLSGQQETADE